MTFQVLLSLTQTKVVCNLGVETQSVSHSRVALNFNTLPLHCFDIRPLVPPLTTSPGCPLLLSDFDFAQKVRNGTYWKICEVENKIRKIFFPLISVVY